MFGVEPEVGERYGVPYVDVAARRRRGQRAVQRGRRCSCRPRVHEGFCLPPLEAMATGCAVVCTDAHGNRDFCRDGENCLMPEADARGGGGGHRAACSTTTRCATRLVAEGRRTAAVYAWDKRTDELEAALEALAGLAPRPRRPHG